MLDCVRPRAGFRPNSSVIMDTQISGVGESRGGDMMDLLGSSQDRRINGASGGTTEEILANYDFRPIRRSEMESHPPHAGFDETTSRISRLGVQVLETNRNIAKFFS